VTPSGRRREFGGRGNDPIRGIAAGEHDTLWAACPPVAWTAPGGSPAVSRPRRRREIGARGNDPIRGTAAGVHDTTCAVLRPMGLGLARDGLAAVAWPGRRREFGRRGNDPIRGTAAGEHDTTCAVLRPMGLGWARDGSAAVARPGRRREFGRRGNDPIRGAAAGEHDTLWAACPPVAWTAPGWVGGSCLAGAGGVNLGRAATTLYEALWPACTTRPARCCDRWAWAGLGTGRRQLPGRGGGDESATPHTHPIRGAATVEKDAVRAAGRPAGRRRDGLGNRRLAGRESDAHRSHRVRAPHHRLSGGAASAITRP